MKDPDWKTFGPDDDPPMILRCDEYGFPFSTDDYVIEEGSLCPECPEYTEAELWAHYEL